MRTCLEAASALLSGIRPRNREVSTLFAQPREGVDDQLLKVKGLQSLSAEALSMVSGQASPAGFGSTAMEMVHSARCSVAVVRGDGEVPAASRSIVAHVVGSADDDDVLQFAFKEASRRNAPMVVMTAWQTPFDNLQSDRLINDRERRMRAILDRYVAIWTPRYPDVHVRTVDAYGPFVNYLNDHAKTIQLIIVRATQTIEVQQLVGPNGDHALRPSSFSLLVVR